MIRLPVCSGRVQHKLLCTQVATAAKVCQSATLPTRRFASYVQISFFLFFFPPFCFYCTVVQVLSHIHFIRICPSLYYIPISRSFPHPISFCLRGHLPGLLTRFLTSTSLRIFSPFIVLPSTLYLSSSFPLSWDEIGFSCWNAPYTRKAKDPYSTYCLPLSYFLPLLLILKVYVQSISYGIGMPRVWLYSVTEWEIERQEQALYLEPRRPPSPIRWSADPEGVSSFPDIHGILHRLYRHPSLYG